MARRIIMLIVLGTLAVLAAPAGLPAAQADGSAEGRRSTVAGIRADVSCHDPCDDPFQLKARVTGSAVGGLIVRFSVQGHVFKARTSSGGFAHYHLRIGPAAYPQGVLVPVKASVKHGGRTVSASTWFKPNYN